MKGRRSWLMLLALGCLCVCWAHAGPTANSPLADLRDSRFATVKYLYPREAAAIPKLKALLEAERKRLTRKLVALAREDATSEAWGNDFSPYRDEHTWKVVADLPGWLSLSDRQNIWSGGAHHNTNYDQILWDKAANRRSDPFDLFVSKAAFDARFYKPLCEALDKARSGPEYASIPPCIDPDDEVLVLGSSNGRYFDRVGILLGPYATGGGYAGGSFEVTLPITRAALQIVRPEYRRYFISGRGTLAINIPND